MSITLHKELGVNPRMTFCRRCGGEASELVLMGSRNWKDICQSGDCGKVHYGGVDGRACKKCGSQNLQRVQMTEYEKCPASEWCDPCKNMLKVAKEAAQTGGVLYRCLGCNTEGVLAGTAEIAKEARKKLKVKAPELCGVELRACPNCPKT